MLSDVDVQLDGNSRLNATETKIKEFRVSSGRNAAALVAVTGAWRWLWPPDRLPKYSGADLNLSACSLPPLN